MNFPCAGLAVAQPVGRRRQAMKKKSASPLSAAPGIPSPEESLEGAVERILFYNPDNGYTVCRFLADDGRERNIVGVFPPLAPGERLKISGCWETNPKFGRQFKVAAFLPVLPTSAAGVEKYLSSGLVRGIGPVLARRILKAYGPETLEVLEKKPERLLEVPGVGAAKLAEVKQSWAEHRDVRDLIIFLQEHGISANLATKIHRRYGARSFQVLRSNPYQLCLDLWGVGFKTADQVALRLGLDPGSPDRIKAFLLYLMEKDAEQGHAFSYRADLEESCRRELEVSAERAAGALDTLHSSGAVVTEPSDRSPAVYLPYLHRAESEAARRLAELADAPVHVPPFDADEALSEAETGAGMRYSAAQREAVRECFRRKVLVITGGPGTGKTTVINAVAELFKRWGKPLLLAAPTGRAAKRLQEATGCEAKTIHRLLEFNPKSGEFKRGEGRPLAGEALVVDEFSMVDLVLLHSLLRALPAGMRLVLVGDKDQLPSVGPGNLLRDIIASGRLPVVRLGEIFRQEKDSLIILNAHRINRGQALLYPVPGDREADFYFFRQESEEGTFKTVLTLACDSVPRRLGLPPLSPHIQVISPMYRGLAGVDRLNEELQRRLNPSGEGLRLGTREFRLRDKVMQVRNDYEKDVYNGDIGLVCGLDRTRYGLVVDFDGRQVLYDRDDLDSLTLAYAVSVHKAQGSEYRAVILPLLTQHFIMLQRNLFYTALTRARKLSLVVGSVKALHIAIKNDRQVQRNSLLRARLDRAGGSDSRTKG